jgi:hypothetical protein
VTRGAALSFDAGEKADIATLTEPRCGRFHRAAVAANAGGERLATGRLNTLVVRLR